MRIKDHEDVIAKVLSLLNKINEIKKEENEFDRKLKLKKEENEKK